MTRNEVIDYLSRYRDSFAAPVHSHTSVERVRRVSGGLEVATSQGPISSISVVVATGACSEPRVPALAADFPATIRQLASTKYRNPSQLEDGPVLVVGASASGAQIAEELAKAGREVTLAVGSYVRLPRRYRGCDIHRWLEDAGVLGEHWNEIDDLAKARRGPSLQLVGSPEGRDLDLNALVACGVEVVSRLVGVAGNSAQFSGDLGNTIASADLKLNRLLTRIDSHIAASEVDTGNFGACRPERTIVPQRPMTLDLRSIRTVVWATGFRPSYPWLPDNVLDSKGSIVHDGGVLGEPGMYVLGLPITRQRKSAFLDGVGDDAEALASHLVSHLDTQAR